MFKPDQYYKKLAKQYISLNCAYVYRDGIMVVERRELKSGQHRATIYVNHFWPCDIRIISRDYSQSFSGSSDGLRCTRVIVQDLCMLLAGLTQVEVNYNSYSDASKAKGMRINHLQWTAPNGQRWETLDIESYTTDTTPQPSPFVSPAIVTWNPNNPDTIWEVIEDLKRGGDNYEIHAPKVQD